MKPDEPMPLLQADLGRIDGDRKIFRLARSVLNDDVTPVPV